ncbi:MAG: BatD family protein [Myxococcota bacterium]|nr:BatD family protein [Myxococcota bacterium]
MPARRTLSLIPLIIAASATTVVAQRPAAPAPKIAINVDRQPLVQGESFVLTIRIETSFREDPEVRIPNFGRIRVLRQSESSSISSHFSLSFGSGRTSQTIRATDYHFVLVADKAGRYKLDPVIVISGGRQYKSDPYVLDIIGPKGGPPPSMATPSQPTPAQPTEDPLPGSDAQPSAPVDLDGAKVDRDFFIQTHLNKKQTVVGEAITMTIYLYTAVNISNLNVIREPGTEGFWVENLLPANRRFTTEPIFVAGREYERGVLRKMAIFPIKTGTLTVAPTLVELEVGRVGFFSRGKAYKRTSVPVQVDVVPLPSEDQPGNFNPTNVGQYTFKAGVAPTSVKVGEPVTLTFTVRGEGNLRNLTLPEFKEFNGFKVYDPEGDTDLQVQGTGVTGTRTARILMIPTMPGEYTLPKISWSFFDPGAGKYRTLSSQPQKIKVQETRATGVPAASGSAPVLQPTAGQDRLNRQLRSILTRADIASRNRDPLLTRPWFLIVAIGAVLCYLGVIVASQTRRRLVEGHPKGRSKRADTEALRRLRSLGKQMDGLSPEAFYGELARVLMVFLEERLETAVIGDTNAELKARLIDRNFSEEQAQQVVTEMESCDFARFAQSAGKGEERRQALDRMAGFIRDLAGVRVRPASPEEKR